MNTTHQESDKEHSKPEKSVSGEATKSHAVLDVLNVEIVSRERKDEPVIAQGKYEDEQSNEENIHQLRVEP